MKQPTLGHSVQVDKELPFYSEAAKAEARLSHNRLPVAFQSDFAIRPAEPGTYVDRGACRGRCVCRLRFLDRCVDDVVDAEIDAVVNRGPLHTAFPSALRQAEGSTPAGAGRTTRFRASDGKMSVV